MSKNRPICSIALRGYSPTPISIADTWPEMYRAPLAIIIRRYQSARLYPWKERYERALVAAIQVCHQEWIERRGDPLEYEYIVSADDIRWIRQAREKR